MKDKWSNTQDRDGLQVAYVSPQQTRSKRRQSRRLPSAEPMCDEARGWLPVNEPA